MDKTIEIVVVIVVGLLVASVMIFLAQDRTDSFSDFLGGQQKSAECSLAKTQYENQKCEKGKEWKVKNREEFVSEDLEPECKLGEWSHPCKDESGDEGSKGDNDDGSTGDDDDGSNSPTPELEPQ